MRVAIYTLGCKVNQYETQAMEQELLRRGHTLVPAETEADGYIVNTCSVTAISDKKSRQMIRRCRKLNPNAVVAACGCYVQTHPEVVAALDVDLLAGTGDRMAFLDLFEQAAHEKEPVRLLDDALRRREFEVLPAGGMAERTRAMLKVEDGCVNFCTYCIIPYARGRCRSIPLAEAVRQAAFLEKEGYQEIVVTGIEVSSYGIDLPDHPSPAALLAAICRAAPHTRIRVGSLEPRTITPEFLEEVGPYPNLCPHFHLSLQSGCPDTLRRMNRKYTPERYAQSVEMLQTAYLGCAVTTDLIVGFPGESREDFEESLAFVEACGLAQVHVFPYSRRKGTPAYSMPNQIPQKEKEERSREAIGRFHTLHQNFLRSKVGQVLPVLFEQEKDGLSSGFSPEYCEVRVNEKELHNQLLSVRITGLSEDGWLTGSILPENP